MSSRWQYLTVDVKPKTWGGHDPKVLQEHLTRQGLLGWELVQAINHGAMHPVILVFKKES